MYKIYITTIDAETLRVFFVQGGYTVYVQEWFIDTGYKRSKLKRHLKKWGIQCGIIIWKHILAQSAGSYHLFFCVPKNFDQGTWLIDGIWKCSRFSVEDLKREKVFDSGEL